MGDRKVLAREKTYVFAKASSSAKASADKIAAQALCAIQSPFSASL